MRQTTCRQTSLPLAPQYQGTDYTEDIKAFSWHPFQFGRRQAVSACSGSPPQCSTFSSLSIYLSNSSGQASYSVVHTKSWSQAMNHWQLYIGRQVSSKDIHYKELSFSAGERMFRSRLQTTPGTSPTLTHALELLFPCTVT